MSTATNPSGGEESLIRVTAYLLWEQSGSPDGRSEEFWFAAERALAAPTAEAKGEPSKAGEPTPNAKKAA